jgi:hypothetical protein
MSDIPWKVGDLGRFEVEEANRPRFEVLGSKPERGVAIWYGGSSRPVFVPHDTFKARCLNTWTIEVVPPMPPWVAPNAVFKIGDERAAKITQAVIKQNFSRQIQQIDVQGHDLRIRRIQYDYCSCFDEMTKTLVMVPLKIVKHFGGHLMSRWDRLLSDHDIIGEELDTIDELLSER